MTHMSEGLQKNQYEELQRQMNAGFELQKQDNEDPERGPIVQQVRAVQNAAYKNFGNEESTLYPEFQEFQKSFGEHFGRAEAQRYRLYHVIISSTPPGNADLFDAKGEWSIAAAMQKLAEKHHIEYPDAQAA